MMLRKYNNKIITITIYYKKFIIKNYNAILYILVKVVNNLYNL